jgi:hypothetical protein
VIIYKSNNNSNLLIPEEGMNNNMEKIKYNSRIPADFSHVKGDMEFAFEKINEIVDYINNKEQEEKDKFLRMVQV